MVEQYLFILWQWISTAFVKMLVVWCAITLLAFLGTRVVKMRVKAITFASPKREGVLSLLMMLGILALLFVLQLLQVPGEASFLTRGLLLTGTSLLMCLPIGISLKLRRQTPETVGLSRENLPAALALGTVLALATLALFAAITLLNKGALASKSLATPQRLLYLITTFTISALAHEFIYRGYLQTRLSAWGGKLKGLLASALIYALWHWPKFLQAEFNGITMLVQFIALFAFGLALGIIYNRTKSILPATLFHASNDLAQTLWSLV
ncbi:MAG: CPBP family intramembrane metalloprotease [Anaerolineae bacterium]|nr:CPBP family intramembrane metalloprotease [Anaerolineae bacterium]